MLKESLPLNTDWKISSGVLATNPWHFLHKMRGLNDILSKVFPVLTLNDLKCQMKSQTKMWEFVGCVPLGSQEHF